MWWPFPRIHRFSPSFSSTQHTFRRIFCSGVSSFGTILAQTFFMSKCSFKIVWTDEFPKPGSSASQSAVCEQERKHKIDVFTTTWGGRASWPLIVLGVFTPFPETQDPLEKKLFPLGHPLHKHVATFD
jgi:hypothetical protein